EAHRPRNKARTYSSAVGKEGKREQRTLARVWRVVRRRGCSCSSRRRISAPPARSLVSSPVRRGATMAGKGGPTNLEKEQMFGMAEKEMEYRVDLFNRLTKTCFEKCVEKRYKEAELNMGENSCIDRCVSKYWQVTNLVGQMLGNQPQM
uniref:Mitochondrial import inner membrane translocase subunit n=2 Tax=Zea mays TaxID=4577 RepID=A0A804P6G5_MAIZE